MSIEEQALNQFNLLKSEIKDVKDINSKVLAFTITVTGAILTFGISKDFSSFERPWVLLFTYVIIFPALLFIIGNSKHMWRISTYLRVFVEPKLSEIKYETRLNKLHDPESNIHSKKQSSRILANNISLFLSLSAVPLIALLLNSIQSIYTQKSIEFSMQIVSSLISLLIGFILFFRINYLGKKASKELERNGVIEKNYYDSWKKIKQQEDLP